MTAIDTNKSTQAEPQAQLQPKAEPQEAQEAQGWLAWLGSWFSWSSASTLPRAAWQLGDKPTAAAIFGPSGAGKAALAEQLWTEMQQRAGSKRLLRFDELTTTQQAAEAITDHAARQNKEEHRAQQSLLFASSPLGDSRPLRTHLRRLFEKRCRLLTWSVFCLHSLDQAPWYRSANFDRVLLSGKLAAQPDELQKLHRAFFAKQFPDAEALGAELARCAWLVLDVRQGQLSQL